MPNVAPAAGASAKVGRESEVEQPGEFMITLQRDWATIPKQTLLVENGEVGDCWRCCVAAILGLPASDVPHFQAGEGARGGDGKYSDLDADTQAWLNDRGLMGVHVGGRNEFRFSCWHGIGFQQPPLISSGPSERSRGMGRHHAVVTVGGKVVYDPHPSEAGLTAITEQWLIFRPVGMN